MVSVSSFIGSIFMANFLYFFVYNLSSKDESFSPRSSKCSPSLLLSYWSVMTVWMIFMSVLLTVLKSLGARCLLGLIAGHKNIISFIVTFVNQKNSTNHSVCMTSVWWYVA